MDKKIKYPPHEHLTHVMLEDLGLKRMNAGDCDWTDGLLEAKGLKVSDFGNGCWHFAMIHNAYQGIGQMRCLDDLLVGYKFVTGQNLLNN